MQLCGIMLNCLICHLLWCQDVLFPSDILLSIEAFLTFLNVFVKKFVVYFMFPQESVTDQYHQYHGTYCFWQTEGPLTLPFLGSTLENFEALQSFLPIPWQFHFSVKDSDGFTCSVCYFALYFLYTFNIFLTLHASMKSENLMLVVRP